MSSVFDYGSGLDFKRDGLQKINSAVEAGSIDAVLVQDISRIGRDFFILMSISNIYRKHYIYNEKYPINRNLSGKFAQLSEIHQYIVQNFEHGTNKQRISELCKLV